MKSIKVSIVVALIASMVNSADNTINLEIKKLDQNYKFGENIEIIGRWDIKSKNSINFLLSAGNRWDIKFSKDGNLYKDGKTTSQLRWKYSGNGIIKTEFHSGENGERSLGNFMLSSATDDKIRIIKKISEKCFKVEVINSKHEVEMCKTEGRIFKDRNAIKIEIE